MDLSILSDLHKEARGFRPSVEYTTWFAGLPKEKQLREWDGLLQESDERNEREAAEQKDALMRWEGHMKGLMRVHNIPLKDAIKWDLDAEEIQIHSHQDIEHYCFINNLPHNKWAEIVEMFFPKRMEA